MVSQILQMGVQIIFSRKEKVDIFDLSRILVGYSKAEKNVFNMNIVIKICDKLENRIRTDNLNVNSSVLNHILTCVHYLGLKHPILTLLEDTIKPDRLPLASQIIVVQTYSHFDIRPKFLTDLVNHISKSNLENIILTIL
eukprot:UN28091